MKDWVVKSPAGDKLVDEANRQINAANGNALQWIFSDKKAGENMMKFLKDEGVGIKKIEFRHVPKPDNL